MVRYEAEREKRYSPEIGWYISYGIRAYRRVGEEWEPLLTVPDVSPDRDRVEQLAWRCTEGQLDPIHLRDVIEDWL